MKRCLVSAPLVTCALAVLGALAVIALFTFAGAKETREAQDKADQLISALEDAGARTPDRDQIVRVLGDQGGATCANPNGALTRGLVLNELTNGAAGPGRRPIIVEDRVLKSQLLIIGVYCPDELPNYEEFVDRLETANAT